LAAELTAAALDTELIAERVLNRLLKLKHCPQEAAIWNCLQGVKTDALRFKRQFRIGPYVVDFCCPSMKLIVEVSRDNGAVTPTDAYDQMRISYLESAGYNVLRFCEEEARDHGDRIITTIRECIGAMHPTN
jgi:very-short-patch-repair endonuclease